MCITAIKLREAQEALLSYAAIHPCPGFVVEAGFTTGCSYGADCPTCQALHEAQLKDA